MEVVLTVGQSQTLWDAENKIIKLYFAGDMTDDAYKEFWTKTIDYGEKLQVNRIIIDQRDIGNVSFNARGWVVINAFPRIKRVLPNNIVAGVLGSNKIVQKTGMQYLLKAFKTLTGYKVEIFATQEEAIAFICSSNKPVQVPA
ncbi:hypothetical protein [Cesiribacter andamanensis]|uniref:STAS/SEC14 domain-containing protein n=1 Tax=Cesiribacter andamanensis AMV16 TaxID=1279009 RepID=M7NAZ9_9BACT|nr:hypothetical protein [Cesiribacter andamanensis]EMR04361.1 hypothetical protein ADICEAN_00524 [Cesiribacter andamanensis AMV16]